MSIKALGRDEMQDVSIDIGYYLSLSLIVFNLLKYCRDEKDRHVAFLDNILAISSAFSIHLYEIKKYEAIQGIDSIANDVEHPN